MAPDTAAGDLPLVNVRKIGHMVQISRDLAMDYGLIPDDRPAPPPPTRRQRFRWWRQDRLRRVRMQLASWIAGFDVEDSY